MDKRQDIRTTESFVCKKWALISLCSVGIVVVIITASIGSTVMYAYIESNYADRNWDSRQSLKNTALHLLWMISGLSILLHLVGLMGAYKENFCMTVTYAVIMSVATLGSIKSVHNSPYYLFVTVVYFVVCVLSYAYAYDLRRIRLMLFNSPTMVVISGGLSPGNVVNMSPGQAYVAGVQHSGHYGQAQGILPQPYMSPPPYSAPYKHNY